MDFSQRPAVVLDCGTGYSKAGFAGNLEPHFILPTVVSLNDSFAASVSAAAGGALSGFTAAQLHSAGVLPDLDFLIGQEAVVAARGGSYALHHPLHNGQVTDWDSMERFLLQCTFGYLRCDPQEHPFVVSEPTLSPPESREQLAEIFFETFNVPGLYIADQSVLAMQAASAAAQVPPTGLLIDAGESSTRIVPIVEGFVMTGGVRTLPIGGSHATQFTQQLMKERGELIPADEAADVARRVKEAYGYSCSDVVKEFSKHDREPAKYRKQWSGVNSRTGHKFTADVGYERFLAAEIFFEPEIFSPDVPSSLPSLADLAVKSCPIDTRRSLYKNVVLAGGSSMFKGFEKRFQRDLKRCVDSHRGAGGGQDVYHSTGTALEGGENAKECGVEVNVLSHTVQRYATWFGGSVVATSPGFVEACHTKEEYDEVGPSICRSSRPVQLE